MFKKKPIYIIGIILFTMILIADLVLYFMIPAGIGRGYIGDFVEGKPGGGFAPGNSGFDSMEGADNSATPSFDGFGAPEGEYGEFTMPEGLDIPEGMSPPNGMTMPEGFDPTGRPNGGQMGGVIAVLSAVRSGFWPVLALCILGDGLCIIMLLHISRKKKAAQTQPDSRVPEELPPMGEEDR